jgi:hypothetical protein
MKEGKLMISSLEIFLNGKLHSIKSEPSFILFYLSIVEISIFLRQQIILLPISAECSAGSGIFFSFVYCI